MGHDFLKRGDLFQKH